MAADVANRLRIHFFFLKKTLSRQQIKKAADKISNYNKRNVMSLPGPYVKKIENYRGAQK